MEFGRGGVDGIDGCDWVDALIAWDLSEWSSDGDLGDVPPGK
jgi:hypothetical protein